MTSRELVARALGVGWEDLPDDARHAARLSLADGLSVMMAAVLLEPACAPFADHVRGAGPARLLAGGRAVVAGAALANGALAHALDFEDTFDAAGLHPNAAAIPALLALAEAEDASLGDLLTALAVAADFACRLGLALTVDPAGRGWYHPPMIGALGAALGAAHLLRLPPEAAVAALSLTQAQFALTDGLKASPASHLRAVRDGFAARAAVEAALLARAGVVGNAEPLEEFARHLAGGPLRPEAFEGLGHAFHGPEVTLKLWPSCRGTHGAIALALVLRDEGVATEEIASVAVSVSAPDDMLFHPLADRQRPATAVGAKFSIPFCFASALCHGAPGLKTFADAARGDEVVLALAARVTMAGMVAQGEARAELVFSDGKRVERPLPPPPRLPAGTTPFADVEAKFAACLAEAGQADRRAGLMALESLPAATRVRGLL